MNRLSAHASPFGAIRMVPLLALTLVWGMVSLQAQTLTSEITGFGRRHDAPGLFRCSCRGRGLECLRLGGPSIVNHLDHFFFTKN